MKKQDESKRASQSEIRRLRGLLQKAVGNEKAPLSLRERINKLIRKN